MDKYTVTIVIYICSCYGNRDCYNINSCYSQLRLCYLYNCCYGDIHLFDVTFLCGLHGYKDLEILYIQTV